MSLDVTAPDRPVQARVEELLRAGWPRFSEAERRRRREVLRQAAEQAGVDLVLAYGADRAGTAVQYFCGWPVTREAALVLDLRSGDDVLFVDFHNHVPLATELAEDCTVRWAGPAMADSLAEELGRREAGGRRVGLMGPVGFGLHDRLAGATAGLCLMVPMLARRWRPA